MFLKAGENRRQPLLQPFNLHFQETPFVSNCRHTTGTQAMQSFNLHFQETPFVSPPTSTISGCPPPPFNLHFQETPFVSLPSRSTRRKASSPFNLHFQETPFVSPHIPPSRAGELVDFQSPFSGDSLCFLLVSLVVSFVDFSFNLHFQETPFVSKKGWWYNVDDVRLLSISIFRRLPLFRAGWQDIDVYYHGTFNLHFQETPFVSGGLIRW